MRSTSSLAVVALLFCGVVAGCGPGDDPNPNPDILWLALDGTETQVRLIATEPTRY